MKRFITSDLHIGHENILKFEPISRQFSSIEEHDNFIRKTWNYYVNDGDMVFVAGDVGMKCPKQYLRDFVHSLKGNKILIRGNHDKWTDASLYDLGFGVILEEAKIRVNSNLVIKISHYPYYESGSEFECRFRERRPAIEDIWLWHGHTHSNSPKIVPEKKVINIGWDHWKRPVDFGELANMIYACKEV